MRTDYHLWVPTTTYKYMLAPDYHLCVPTTTYEYRLPPMSTDYPPMSTDYHLWEPTTPMSTDYHLDEHLWYPLRDTYELQIKIEILFSYNFIFQ